MNDGERTKGRPMDEFGALKRRIAELKQIEDKLRLFRNLINKSNDAIFVIDPKTSAFLDVNDTACRKLGYTREELCSLGVKDIKADRRTTSLWEDHVSRLRKKGAVLLEDIVRKKDGTTFPVEINVSYLIQDDGNYLISVMRDITERKKAEGALQAENAFRRAIEASMVAGIAAVDLEGRQAYVNRAFCKMVGWPEQELLGAAPPFVYWPPEDIETIQESMRKNVSGKRPSSAVELRFCRRNGERFYVLAVHSPLRDSGGKETGWLAVFYDITERKQAEDALRQTNARLETLIQAIPDMVFFKDAAGRHLLVNRSAEDSMGRSRDEIAGKTAEELLPPGPAAACRKSDEEAMRRRAPTHVEEQIPRRDGSAAHIDFVKAPIFDDRNNVVGLVAIGRDITERKKAEEELRRNREFIKSILDTVDEGFIVIDRDYRIISANNAYSRQANLRAGNIIGKRCYEISHRRETPCYEAGEDCAVRRSFETGEPSVCMHKHHAGDGNVIFVETKSYPLRDASGSITSAIEVINNITEKHLLEEQLLRNQKLEAVGLLAGGIAHDFNNLLQGVFGGISLAKQLADRGSALYRHLDEAERALQLARSLTKQLLTFSKGGEPVKSVVSLPPLILDSAKFALSGSNVDFHFSKATDLWPVEADEGQISQVIQNIVLNAIHAMPRGGTVKIRADNLVIEKGNSPGLDAGRYVKIDIEDCGTGIPRHHISRIFDPYFTTKEQGNGLGLATSYSIIKKHNGLLDVRSELGAGSTFTVYLPASGGMPLPAREAEKGVVRGKGRVLFMDDEEIVRDVAGYMLESLGYEADFAENGEQAVEKYMDALNSRKPYDAVILDLTIRGGTGGVETIKRLREADPAVRAIVSSGYSDDLVAAQYKDFGFKASLSKPYEVESLSRVLHSTISNEE